MRISDWSSDVCSSDLPPAAVAAQVDERPEFPVQPPPAPLTDQVDLQIGAAGREGIAADAAAHIEAGQNPVVVGAIVARHADHADRDAEIVARPGDRKSTRLNSSH